MPQPNTSDSAVFYSEHWRLFLTVQKFLGTATWQVWGTKSPICSICPFRTQGCDDDPREKRCRALLGPGRNAVGTSFQQFREHWLSSFNLILSWQACLWMQHTLDFCKVFDLIVNDNLNWYDTNLLWQMLKGLTNDKWGGLNAIPSGNLIQLAQP